MKKLLVTTTLIASALMAEVTTITPYGGTIDYGNDATKSFKDKATLLGAHMSIGTLDYLLEADYSHIATKYIDTTIPDLKQDDITLAYSKYNAKTMFKVGVHYINTNDKQLDNGVTGIVALGAYKYFGYDKLSYGVEGYYSYYKNGHDENYLESKKINIFQETPYISYYKSININWGNTFTLKGYFQQAQNYVKKNYSSFEVSDTLFYKSFFATLIYYNGEMRTGVKDGGMTVFNTLDLMKNGYSTKLGYYITKNAVASISYTQNTYTEYGLVVDNTNSVAIASLNYSF
jgi:hypothetical protein